MLRPPLRIFIAHRNGAEEFNRARTALEGCRKDGFRIEILYVNDGSFRYSGNIPKLVFEYLDSADVAIVMMTKDERISTKRRALPSYSVMFEWGYLSSSFGKDRDERILLLGQALESSGKLNRIKGPRPDIKPSLIPSTSGEFDVWVREYLSGKRKQRARGCLLICEDEPVRIDNGDLGQPEMSESDLVRHMWNQIGMIPDPAERILYIFERAFLGVYLDDNSFWRDQVDSIRQCIADARQKNETLNTLLEALECIFHYIFGSWRDTSGVLTDAQTDDLFGRLRRLERCSESVDFTQLHPIVGIIIFNYIGLYYSRKELSKRVPGVQKDNALNCFRKALRIAERVECGKISLWRGFIQYNIAGVIIATKGADPYPAETVAELNSALEAARNARRTWVNAEVEMPMFLRDLFQIEYFSALKQLADNYQKQPRGRLKAEYLKQYNDEVATWYASKRSSRFRRAAEHIAFGASGQKK